MKPLHLFAPLRKQPGFPVTSADLKIGDVRYDLILPENISDLLLLHFIDSTGSYRRVDRYCDLDGIEAIRKRPSLLDDAYTGLPTFAMSFNGVEDVQDNDAVIGYVALRLAIGPLAARQLRNRARRRESIDGDLAEYIATHDAYFTHGFELLRIRYYFDKVDRYAVMLDLEQNEPPRSLLERRGEKTRFRDLRTRSFQRKARGSTEPV